MKLARIESTFIKKDGQFAGVCFGYTMCDEHDAGFGGIMAKLGVGVNPDAMGLDKLRVYPEPGSLTLVDRSEKAAIVMAADCDAVECTALTKRLFLEVNLGDEELACFWDEDGFVLLGVGTGAKHLRTLYADIEANNVVFALPKDSLFQQQMYPALARSQFAKSEWASRLRAA